MGGNILYLLLTRRGDLVRVVYPKSFFQVNKTKNRETRGPLKSAQEVITTSGEEMIKILNNYFFNVFI